MLLGLYTLDYTQQVLVSSTVVALFSGHVGGEKWPGMNCLHICDNPQKNLGICVCLEIVGKINMHKLTSYIP